jgi:hypothetical protein
VGVGFSFIHCPVKQEKALVEKQEMVSIELDTRKECVRARNGLFLRNERSGLVLVRRGKEKAEKRRLIQPSQKIT